MKHLGLLSLLALTVCGSMARAEDLRLDLSSIAPMYIDGKDVGSYQGSFFFDTDTINGGSYSFRVNKGSPGAGLFGNIGGTFLIGTVSQDGKLYTAPVTPGGNNIFSITDAQGVKFTADLAFFEIGTLGSLGGVNTSLVQITGGLNLTNFQYTGTNPDLIKLRELSAGELAATFQTQDSPGSFKTLQELVDSNGPAYGSSYSATLTATAVPTPATFVMMAVGGCAFMARIKRRRQPEVAVVA
jgi:hypothetical protein